MATGTTKEYRTALRDVLLDIRYCARRDDLHGRVTYAQGLIHGARFGDQIGAAEHERLFALMQDARRRAYAYFAEMARQADQLQTA